MGLAQRFWALFRVDHRFYQEAYAKYEDYSRKLGLDLLGPSTDQIRIAREAPLIAEIDALYDRALEASKTAGMPYNCAIISYQKGLLCRLIGDYRAAEAFFRQALHEFEASLPRHASARRSISMCHFYLGQALLRVGESDSAKKHLTLAVSLDEVLGDPARIRAAKSMLSECRSGKSQ